MARRRSGGPELLASAYRRSLEVAAELGARTVGLPGLSTGIYGYPVEQAAPVAVAAVREALARLPAIEEARFVLVDAATREVFAAAAGGDA